MIAVVTTRGRLSMPLLLAIATVFGVSSSIQAYFLQLASGDESPALFSHVMVLNMVYWYVPALVAPVIMWLASRYQLGRVRWPALVAIHLTGALTYAFIHTAAMLATRTLVLDRPLMLGWWHAAQIEFLTQLDWMFMTYLFLVGLAHALAYRHESEARALDSAHLETRLVEAQLQSLQRQLHPHFLFNTLNTISGLMRSDVNAADRMIDRLGDLLRMTLSTSNIQEVPLREELDMLQKYLDIEQTRFGSRLSVRMTIHPDTLDAHVPNLLLQPLVENAVRHGIAPHSRPGLIVVDASQVAGQLRLQVRDSGDGLPVDRLTLLNQGVGLANTRARLNHLYRQNHEFVFSNAEGGLCVTVSIPFVVDRPAAEPVRMGAA
jgi:two-component system, LytTR family, sensor kinase